MSMGDAFATLLAAFRERFTRRKKLRGRRFAGNRNTRRSLAAEARGKGGWDWRQRAMRRGEAMARKRNNGGK